MLNAAKNMFTDSLLCNIILFQNVSLMFKNIYTAIIQLTIARSEIVLVGFYVHTT